MLRLFGVVAGVKQAVVDRVLRVEIDFIVLGFRAPRAKKYFGTLPGPDVVVALCQRRANLVGIAFERINGLRPLPETF